MNDLESHVELIINNSTNEYDLIQQLIARGLNGYEINISLCMKSETGVPKEWTREKYIIRKPTVALTPREDKHTNAISSDE